MLIAKMSFAYHTKENINEIYPHPNTPLGRKPVNQLI